MINWRRLPLGNLFQYKFTTALSIKNQQQALTEFKIKKEIQKKR